MCYLQVSVGVIVYSRVFLVFVHVSYEPNEFLDLVFFYVLVVQPALAELSIS